MTYRRKPLNNKVGYVVIVQIFYMIKKMRNDTLREYRKYTKYRKRGKENTE